MTPPITRRKSGTSLTDRWNMDIHFHHCRAWRQTGKGEVGMMERGEKRGGGLRFGQPELGRGEKVQFYEGR